MNKPIIDELGNELRVDRGRVTLKLTGAKRSRYLGQISRGILYVHRNTKRHLMRIYAGYGFCLKLLELAEQLGFYDVEVTVSTDELTTFRGRLAAIDMLTLCVHDQYRGFEQQGFLTLTQMRKLRDMTPVAM